MLIRMGGRSEVRWMTAHLDCGEGDESLICLSSPRIVSFLLDMIMTGHVGHWASSGTLLGWDDMT